MSANDVFEVFTDSAGKYRWRLKVASQEIVAVSEPHEAKEGAIRSVHKMPEWSSNTPVKDLTSPQTAV
jgi:uncharacterized protein YegP (UPF0339 family)